MKALKSLIPLAKWLLRLTVALLVYSIYFELFMDFELSSVKWFISLIIIVFTVLLLLGGFLKNSRLTVISGLLIFVLSLIMVLLGGISMNILVLHLAPASIGFYFMAQGNKT